MTDGSIDLQGVIVNTLKAINPPLASGGVHSPAPQGVPLPYVEVGETGTVTNDVQCRSGLDETATIHVWTSFGTLATAKTIVAKIREALHAKNLAVPGRSAAFFNVTGTRVFTDLDSEAIHGVVTLSVSHFGQKES